MNRFIKDVLIFGVLILIAFMIWNFIVSQTALDIQLHDTYFAIDPAHLILMILGSLTFFIFLAGALNRRFRSLSANLGLIVGLALTVYLIFNVVQVEENLRDVLLKDRDVKYSNIWQGVSNLDRSINWTWGLFWFFTIGTVVISLHTYRLWRIALRKTKSPML